MRESVQRDIDGHTWRVQQYTATLGLKIFTRFSRLVGGSVGKAIGSLSPSGNLLDSEINFEMIGNAIGDLTGKLDEDEVIDFVKLALSNTRCDGREVLPEFDLLFMANYKTLIKVLFFVLEVNYQIPFSDYLGFLGLGQQVQTEDKNRQIQVAS